MTLFYTDLLLESSVAAVILGLIDETFSRGRTAYTTALKTRENDFPS